METAIFKSNSKKDLRLLIDLAKKIGVTTQLLSLDTIEDIGLAKAIKKGRTGKFVDTNEFLDELQARAK